MSRRCRFGGGGVATCGVCDCAQADAEARAERCTCTAQFDPDPAAHDTDCPTFAEDLMDLVDATIDDDFEPDERLAWGGLDIPS